MRMCRSVGHHHISRHVCICIAIYTIIGLKLPCNILCDASLPPLDHHLNELFNLATNTTIITKEQLSSFLVTLNLSPPDHTHDEETGNHSVCYSAEQMLSFFPNTHSLNKQQFSELVPTMLYEIQTDACHHEHHETVKSRSLDWKAIVGSTVANIVISISGLIVVALIPLMPRRFFHVTSQFLIALSVGSLIGDAFLHLVPHALAPPHDHSHEESDHSGAETHHHTGMITKSLVALLGIYAFFLTERLTILCQNRTSRRKMKRQRSNFNDLTGEKEIPFSLEQNGSVKTDGDKTVSTAVMNSVGIRFQKPKPIVDGSENPALTSDTTPSSNEEVDLCGRPPERPMDNARCVDHLRGDSHVRPNSVSGDAQQHDSPAQYWPSAIRIPVNEVNHGQATDDLTSSASSPSAFESHKRSKRTDPHDVLDLAPKNGKVIRWKQTEVSAEAGFFRTSAHLDTEEGQPTHPHRDKPHGHHHGHSHDLSSVKAIAYTVIVGDGLHNFCDGIAIGAAFSTDLTGGLSTAIAVLCHELPHELGDFAVLLHAGMSVKAAVFYNLLSSVLCAAGTVIGLLLGRVASVDTWIFMLTAGMFVYIALVDMMPELATNRLKGHRYCHQPSTLFIWQNFGIILGAAVMLVIALYENQIY